MAFGPGSRLGPYEILSLLGAGGMGEVYFARDTRLDREVAIKVLAPYLASEPAALTRFEREAKAVAALSHPAIVAIHDFATHEGTTYAVTELLVGQTLRERLAAGSLPVRTALEYTVQVTEGLAAAHDKGLVHRDLKPENLFVTTEGRAKILDFGLVRRAPAESEAGTVTVSSPTIPGTLLGTVGYMSPEQAAGRPVDFRSDQFSLGSVLYEMLSGRRAFARPSSPETLSAIIRDEPAPIAALNLSVPAPLRWILERCLAKDPAARYASTHDLARELRTLLEHLPEATPAADLPSAVPATPPTGRSVQRLRRSKPAIVAAATALLVLVSAGVYLLRTRSEPATIDSLAVLPLTNASDDPQTEYLSDGITEVLINSLSRLPTLKVLARTTVFRYRGASDPIKVGRELGVQALLTGKVVQRGDRLTLQVDLVDVASGAQLWGDQYNRKLADVLAVQEEIARHVSETLRPRFTGDQERRLARHSTDDAEAHQLYLRGRFHWNKLTEEDVAKSIDYFNQALARDPGYALAYVGLADAYGALGQIGHPPKENAAKAKAAVEKALELDERLPEAHNALGAYELFYGWDWAVAERELKLAIELNYGPAHDLYGQFLTAMGRIDDGIAENRAALNVDPLSALSSSNLAQAYYLARQHDRALEQSRSAQVLDPEFFLSYLYLGAAYSQRGNYQQAVTELLKARGLSGGFAPATSELGHVYAISGRRREAQQMLRELEAHASRQYTDPFYIAIVHLGLGDLDQTFVWLGKAYDERSFWLLYLNVEPKFDRLRQDPRFAALQRRLNLPK